MTTSHPPADTEPAATTAGAAVGRGWAQLGEHWGSVGFAYVLSLMLSLPLAAALQSSLAASLAHREAAERLLVGWDGLWHHTYAAQAQGIAATFDAGVVGIGAVLRALDALVTGTLLDLPGPIVVVGLLYLTGWVFLSGALLARFGGDQAGLLTLGRRHFSRMFSVAAVGWVAWAIVLAVVLPWLTEQVDRACRDVTDERIHVAWVLGKYALVWTLMVAIRLVVDYAKVAAVRDPTRSTAAALQHGWGMCRGHLRPVVGVTVILGAIGLGLLVVYNVIAPGAGQANAFMLLVAFFISQLSVIARVAVRAWGLASAHALAVGLRPGAP